VQRVAILGRGAAGKSVLAARLGQITGLPVIELDPLFWKPGPNATPPAEWAHTQSELVRAEAWIIDGDLGPYDTALGARLAAADTVIVLDFPLVRCAWRAARHPAGANGGAGGSPHQPRRYSWACASAPASGPSLCSISARTTSAMVVPAAVRTCSGVASSGDR
jgi:hypothetical protein